MLGSLFRISLPFLLTFLVIWGLSLPIRSDGQLVPLFSPYLLVRFLFLVTQPSRWHLRQGAKSLPRARSSPDSFVLSIPAPALLTQVDEHSLELYVVTPDGIAVTERVHAAVLVCVKTAAILGAVLSLGPLKEEDYMRLLKQTVESKERLVLQAGCEHSWPCYGKPAIVFHDRGKIFTSERARQDLVDRLGIITEQAPPYAPSANDLVAYCTPFA